MAPTQERHGLRAGGHWAAQRALNAVCVNGAASGASTLASPVAAAGGEGCTGDCDPSIAGRRLWHPRGCRGKESRRRCRKACYIVVSSRKAVRPRLGSLAHNRRTMSRKSRAGSQQDPTEQEQGQTAAPAAATKSRVAQVKCATQRRIVRNSQVRRQRKS